MLIPKSIDSSAVNPRISRLKNWPDSANSAGSYSWHCKQGLMTPSTNTLYLTMLSATEQTIAHCSLGTKPCNLGGHYKQHIAWKYIARYIQIFVINCILLISFEECFVWSVLKCGIHKTALNVSKVSNKNQEMFHEYQTLFGSHK